MKKFLKWVGYFLAGVIGIALVALLGYYINWRVKAAHKIDAVVETFPIPTDEESIARGKLLVEIVRCTECHGEDLAGDLWADHPLAGTFGPANLTPGENGLVNYTDEDYIRALRNGLGQDGKPLYYMPSNFYRDLNQEDLGDLIAYLKTLEPSEDPGPPNNIRPLFYNFVLSNPQGYPAVTMIDQTDTAVPVGPDSSDILAYGEYLALPCKSCHGADLAGVEQLERLGIGSPNLTPYNLADWTEEDFLIAMREGTLPDGRFIPQAFMPWEAIGQLTDEELHAIWVYLESLPSVADADAVGVINPGSEFLDD